MVQTRSSLILLRSLLRTGKPLPWSLLHDWKCYACGDCCRRYLVELKSWEWAKIVRSYGYFSTLISSGGKIYLKRRPDNSCIFLYNAGRNSLCGLQEMKPQACKLWPFQVYENPVFGHVELSRYECSKGVFYIYVVPDCIGLSWGIPSKHLREILLPEIVDIKLGLRVRQKHSTSKLSLSRYSLLTV
jgi:Fe-S-cluster containining protein